MSVGGWEGLSGTRPSGTTLMQAAFDGASADARTPLPDVLGAASPLLRQPGSNRPFSPPNRVDATD